MFKNKKLTPIMGFALSAALAVSGIFQPTDAYAAELSADQKAQLEQSYFKNSVSNRASKMLLEEKPNASKNIVNELTQVVKESDAILAQTKPVVDKLYPERANEDATTKKLDESVFNNRATQEAVFLLFKLSPNTVEGNKAKFEEALNEAIMLTSQGDYQLNKLRGVKQLTIVHVNDTHGRAMEDEKNKELGFPKLKTFYDYKNVASNAMLLNAGDVVHGTTFATISRGQSMIDVMNTMGFQAMTAGNHDFNYGYQELMELNKRANFPIMGSNVVDANGNPILDTARIYEVDGVKVGVFGLATEETRTKSSPVNTEGLNFVSSVDTAKNEVAKLKAEGAQIILCLSHLGEDAASKETSTLIAQNVPEIDIIIDGHSHTQLDNGRYEGNALIAQAKAHGEYIGEVTVKLDKDGKIISKTATIHPYERMKHLKADAATLAQMDQIKASNDTILQVEVGKTDVILDGKREDVRTRETNLGSFIADAMIEATGADVALTNGGGIREAVQPGTITKNDVLTVFPFTNFLVTIDVTGADIRAALEHGLSDAPNPVGKFPQIGGMTVKYDSSKPAGQRVTEVMIGEAPLDDNKTYSLATNDFLAIGGDGYEMFKGKTRTSERGLISDIFEQAIRKEGTISPGTYNRIEDISEAGLVNRAA